MRESEMNEQETSEKLNKMGVPGKYINHAHNVIIVEITGRAQPNLTRTLAKLEAAGFIRMKTVGRRKAPSVAVKRIVVEIDPYSDRDRLRVA